MAQLMLIDVDSVTLTAFRLILRAAGYQVVTAGSEGQGLLLLEQQQVDLVLTVWRPPDLSGSQVLRYLRGRCPTVPLVVVTGVGSNLAADASPASGSTDTLVETVEELLAVTRDEAPWHTAAGRSSDREAPAAARWARVVALIVDSPRDPRTTTEWSRLAFASPGALRNWCRTVGISPRRSLVFARLLRAVFLANGGKHRPENLLDVVDRRTLVGLLTLAGLNPDHDFPEDVETFLERQALVRDPDALLEIKRALALRLRRTALPRNGAPDVAPPRC